MNGTEDDYLWECADEVTSSGDDGTDIESGGAEE